MRLSGSYLLTALIGLFAVSCSSNPAPPALFEAMESSRTGLKFTNTLTSTDSFNLFKYMYFYNGAGVASADFNNDGFTDLFFCSNQAQNKLFLNEGGLRFKDVSALALRADSGWHTGVSVVDINADGLMDLYVCKVGKYMKLTGTNELLVCTGIDKDGIPHYEDQAKQWGLDFSGFSTQAAFFDYDLDGDLDMFLLNHSVHQNGTFRPRKEFLGTYHELSGDRLYRNDGNHFSDVTHSSGLNSSAISYGLGVVVSDINLDGYPDLYIGNDFHENDYLYLNNRDGTFAECLNDHLMHTSQFSMGVDAADVNNDALPDIISMDMLPSDPYILKRSLGEDEYDIFNKKIGFGYNYQYTRNNLQFNRGNGMFSETGLYSGVSASDWSWSPLWVDFDNDGLKDLFISNGIPKRMNDIDYINFISSSAIQEKIHANKIWETDATLIDKFPKIKLPNKFYRNMGELRFQDLSTQITDNPDNYSNGAVYADFDNDGDEDIVVNNIDDPALLYRNRNNDSGKGKYLRLNLQGPGPNVHAIGAKVVVFTRGQIRLYEKFPVHGFQSSMEGPLLIGMQTQTPDSIRLIWPNNRSTAISYKGGGDTQTIKYDSSGPAFDYSILQPGKPEGVAFNDVTSASGLSFAHHENQFAEFDREPLIPHMLSTDGPATAVADINGDGRDDVFIGSSKWEHKAVFLQNAAGKFERLPQPALDLDSTYEDIASVWADVNKDGHPDLIVASGGNEFYGTDNYLTPRVYLNDGSGQLVKHQSAFKDLFVNAGAITATDINNDGWTDLIIGARSIPWEYGQPPHSFMLLNDGTGKFSDATDQICPEFKNAGFITGLQWGDLNKDGEIDLIVSSEWGSIDAYLRQGAKFRKQALTSDKGWWNFVLPVDVDLDGDIDLIAGNLGLNSRLTASNTQPVRLYYNDFDNNGKREQLLTYYLNGKELLFANKATLDKQIPSLKKRYLYASDFAKAPLREIISSELLDNAVMHSANYFSNAVFINQGNMQFQVRALPWAAQLTSYRDAVIIDANHDRLPDILMGGNFYENNIQMGRYDADFGTVLINQGKGNFKPETLNGINVRGQVRHIRTLKLGAANAALFVRNNDSTLLLTY